MDSEVAHFKESGEQSCITPEIQNIAGKIKGNVIEKSKAILEIMSHLKYTGFDPEIFRKRTAEEIIKDGFVTGCTDSAVVFVTIARACGLSAKYVETLDTKWLKGNDQDIVGHQYAKVYDEKNNKWFWVDPSSREQIDIPSPEDGGKVIFKEGLDSWDIGITDGETSTIALHQFRSNWQAQNHTK
ncbi:transglutaminase domain-containing protein [Candidatus Woesebacteria bacterium]|nr:transglutaminase domain-containing protein [Candidatus Woesebacteria bacterium]